MGNAISAAAIPALCAAISAVELVNLLDHPWPGTSTTVAAQAPPLQSGVRDLLLLTSSASFSISVAFIYRHLHRGAAGNRRLPEMVSTMLCISAGVIQFILFVRAPGGADVVDHGAHARALGLAALRVLPAAATVTFFLGTMLIVAAHIRAGGEGGGGAIAVAGGEELIQPPLGLRLLSRMALAAAEGLICLMAVAVCGSYY